MKLKTAIEYWEHLINQRVETLSDSSLIYWNSAYLDFLKQPLQLWMFIPCDKDGKPLEKPKDYDTWRLDARVTGYTWSSSQLKQCREYQQACDRCLFTGFELYQDTYFNNYNCVIRGSDMVIINIENKTIEDIAPLKVEVTDRVAKQFKY